MKHGWRLDPRITIACLAIVAAGAGALGGAEIGSSPILKNAGDTIPPVREAAENGDLARSASEQPPDHYPLVTPAGTIPVAALAAHGRFRSERLSWVDRPDYVPIADDSRWQYSEAEIDRLETWQPGRARFTRTQVTVSRGSDAQEEGTQLSRAPANTMEAREQGSRPTVLASIEGTGESDAAPTSGMDSVDEVTEEVAPITE